MIGVLDPATPYPYLLYTLAGAGIVVYTLPESVKGLSPVLRDVYRAQPQARILCALVYWMLWPLLALLLVIAGLAGAALWVLDHVEKGKK